MTSIRQKLERQFKRAQKENDVALARLRSVNPLICDVKPLERRIFYDTTWCVVTTQGSVTITRYDTETLASLCETLAGATTVESIRALDMKNQIFYD